VPVVYHGSVPDPFRGGREVIVTVSKRSDGSYAARDNSLITKCPSKYKAQGTQS
jgi:cytochrome c-type biogenesis protein CcmE